MWTLEPTLGPELHTSAPWQGGDKATVKFLIVQSKKIQHVLLCSKRPVPKEICYWNTVTVIDIWMLGSLDVQSINMAVPLPDS